MNNIYPNLSCWQFVQTLGKRTTDIIVYLIKKMDKQFGKDLEMLLDK